MSDMQSYAFVDESGNPNLDHSLDQIFRYYVITAVTTAARDRRPVEQWFEEVRRRHFQTGEMKSSSVGSKDGRRLRILKDIVQEKRYGICCLVVDKDRLTSDGYTFEGSFIKNLHGKLYAELFRSFQHVYCYADEQKDTQFMDGFRNYLRRRTSSHNLFGESDVEFVDSRSHVGVQAADFFCGTIHRSVNQRSSHDQVESFMEAVRERLAFFEAFPRDIEMPYRVSAAPEDEHELDGTVASVALKSAAEFLRSPRSGAFAREQTQCVEYLYHLSSWFWPHRYVSAQEMTDHINRSRDDPLSVRQVRNEVIAPVRDMGVLICSSNKGYKLPVSVADVTTYVDWISAIMVPMVARVGKCAQRLKMATHKRLDILDRSEYREIKAALDVRSSAERLLEQ